ncbi:hypothetical protein SDC9_209682 [bioreactor metagenome]|uniref:Uncharacterized protein n=1 Tax=bioreactor metagenome TaxID=1076179 RepID=A0A645JEN7_9ZZZZ
MLGMEDKGQIQETGFGCGKLRIGADGAQNIFGSGKFFIGEMNIQTFLVIDMALYL